MINTAKRIAPNLERIRKHSDELYLCAESGDSKRAMWHAHEVAKYIGALYYIQETLVKGLSKDTESSQTHEEGSSP